MTPARTKYARDYGDPPSLPYKLARPLTMLEMPAHWCGSDCLCTLLKEMFPGSFPVRPSTKKKARSRRTCTTILDVKEIPIL